MDGEPEVHLGSFVVLSEFEWFGFFHSRSTRVVILLLVCGTRVRGNVDRTVVLNNVLGGHDAHAFRHLVQRLVFGVGDDSVLFARTTARDYREAEVPYLFHSHV